MTECIKIQFTKSTNHRIPYLFQISKLSSKPIKHNLQSIHANEPPRETFHYEIYPWIADLRMMRTTITRDSVSWIPSRFRAYCFVMSFVSISVIKFLGLIRSLNFWLTLHHGQTVIAPRNFDLIIIRIKRLFIEAYRA